MARHMDDELDDGPGKQFLGGRARAAAVSPAITDGDVATVPGRAPAPGAPTSPPAAIAGLLRTTLGHLHRLRTRLAPLLHAASADQRALPAHELLEIRSALRNVERAADQIATAKQSVISREIDAMWTRVQREHAELRAGVHADLGVQDRIASPTAGDAAMTAWAEQDLARREAEVAEVAA